MTRAPGSTCPRAPARRSRAAARAPRPEQRCRRGEPMNARNENDAKLPNPVGIGLRAPYFREFETARPAVGWLEVHAENFIGQGPALTRLERIRRDYALSLHGVGLSLGSAEGLDQDHLRRFRALIERTDPFLVSDHLSWSVTGGVYLNDLLAASVYGGSARGPGAEHIRRAGGVRPAHPDRESVALSRVPPLGNPGAGVPRRARAPHRLRHPARRQQRVRDPAPISISTPRPISRRCPARPSAKSISQAIRRSCAAARPF